MTPLAARLTELQIDPDELAAIIGRPLEQVTEWIDGDAEPDSESRVLLRIVTDPARSYAAELAVERIRQRHSRDMRGEGDAQQIDTPYGGGHAGTTGGTPT